MNVGFSRFEDFTEMGRTMTALVQLAVGIMDMESWTCLANVLEILRNSIYALRVAARDCAWCSSLSWLGIMRHCALCFRNSLASLHCKCIKWQYSLFRIRPQHSAVGFYCSKFKQFLGYFLRCCALPCPEWQRTESAAFREKALIFSLCLGLRWSEYHVFTL